MSCEKNQKIIYFLKFLSKNRQEQVDWVVKEECPWETAWLTKYETSNMISMFGLVMALNSISVVKRLDIVLFV